MRNNEYESMEQIEADFILMFENAKRYNMPNSAIYKRVLKLQQLMQVSVTDPKRLKLRCLPCNS